MALRATEANEYIKHEYSADEIKRMAFDLADAHNRKASVDEEFANVKATFKEKLSAIDALMGSLSRKISQGFEMLNVKCRLVYDCPDVNQVSYIYPETGATIKVRAMTGDEMQQEMDFAAVLPFVVASTVAEQSQQNVEEFFTKPVSDDGSDIDGAEEQEAQQPSADDLDAVAKEQEIADATSSRRKCSSCGKRRIIVKAHGDALYCKDCATVSTSEPEKEPVKEEEEGGSLAVDDDMPF